MVLLWSVLHLNQFFIAGCVSFIISGTELLIVIEFLYCLKPFLSTAIGHIIALLRQSKAALKNVEKFIQAKR